MVSDVPVSLALSSGLDSRLIAESINYDAHDICFYTLDTIDSQFTEAQDSLNFAAHHGRKHIKIVPSKPTFEHFYECSTNLNEPIADTSAMANFFYLKRLDVTTRYGDGGRR